ncbi:MAG: hypothetical protein NVS2B7_10520 [Herpetosiphon sp.]
MNPVPPTIVRWLLTHEAGENPDVCALTAGAAHVHLHLRSALIVFLGQTGFDSLWSRAMHLAQRKLPPIDTPLGAEVMPLLPGLRTATSGHTQEEVRDILLTALTSFVSLLFDFVGADLGFRLLQQIWPELSADNVDTHTGAGNP